jgi:hypothetical protein
MCTQYAAQSVLEYTGTTEGEKRSKLKPGEIPRTRGDIMGDILALAIEHDSDTFTVASWLALDLLNDLGRRKTHFLAVTLSRNHHVPRSSPRRMYTLIDAEALPFDVLNKRYDSYTILGPQDEWPKHPREGLSPGHPRLALESDEEIRLLQGALGSVMVVSVELNERERNRSVQEAVEKVSSHFTRLLQSLETYPLLTFDLADCRAYVSTAHAVPNTPAKSTEDTPLDESEVEGLFETRLEWRSVVYQIRSVSACIVSSNYFTSWGRFM